MGMNTILVVRNDGVHDIVSNAQEFVDGLHTAIQQHGMGFGSSVAAGSSANVADVVAVTHSSHDYFVRVGGNTARAVGWASATQEDLDAMAAFLKAKGYGIRKPRAKPV